MASLPAPLRHRSSADDRARRSGFGFGLPSRIGGLNLDAVQETRFRRSPTNFDAAQQRGRLFEEASEAMARNFAGGLKVRIHPLRVSLGADRAILPLRIPWQKTTVGDDGAMSVRTDPQIPSLDSSIEGIPT